MNKQIFTALFIALCAHHVHAQPQGIFVKPRNTATIKNYALRHQLDSIAGSYNAIVGVSVLAIESRDTITVNNNDQYAMQSVYKFPLALCILSKVDKGKLLLTQKVHINKDDLHPTWSPLRDKYPDGNIDMTIKELLEYTVSKSDNIACDILFKQAGGTKVVNDYIHDLGIKDIAIAATEKEMSESWEVQYSNWAKPNALTQLMDGFYRGKYLSANSRMFLLKIMTLSENSPNRIKGFLPTGATVAHKTGTSNTNGKGLTAAVNDIGIITLPNGKHVALVTLVANTTETKETAEQIIAKIAKATYNYFAKKK